MALVNFLRLFSIFSLAILNISLSALPVDALAVDRGHIGRGPNHAHAGLAKRNNSSGRCRPRPSPPSTVASSSPESGNHVYTPASEPAPTSPASPHTTPTPTSTTSYASKPVPTAFSKFGVAWSNNEEQSITNFITPDSPKRLVHNWKYVGYGSVITLPENAIYMATVPNAQVNWNDVTTTLKNAQSYSRLLRTFNEPDIAGQANMDPATAFQLIKTYLTPLIKQSGYTILSPAVTTGPNGIKWLTDFHSHGDCGISVTDVHFYGTSSSGFTTSVDDFSKFGFPLIYSEVGAMDYYHMVQPTTQQVDDVLNGFHNTCQNDSRIVACFWFGFFRADEIPGSLSGSNSLIECPNNTPGKSCKPNARGQQYLSF